MLKQCTKFAGISCVGLLMALAFCPACTSQDDGGEAKNDSALPETPNTGDAPAFAETSKASLTHKGKTLDFHAAVGIVRAGSKLVEVVFFPYPLTKTQRAALLAGDAPESVNRQAPGHDPANWPHKPMFALKIYLKDDSRGFAAADIARCSLNVRGWDRATGISGVPLESTVETMTLSGTNSGERLRCKGTAKGRYDDGTVVTFEADTIVVVPAL